MICRLGRIADDRWDIRRELTRLGLRSPAHAPYSTGGIRALPNRVPRALAAGCQDVDAELLANGMSVATNSTPDSMGVATKPGL